MSGSTRGSPPSGSTGSSPPSGDALDDTVAYPVWWWQLDELLGLVVGLMVVEVARLQGFAYQRKNTAGWEPDADVQGFIAELWERCCGG